MRQLVALLHNISVSIYIMHSIEEIHLITPPSLYLCFELLFSQKHAGFYFNIQSDNGSSKTHLNIQYYSTPPI